MLKFIENSNNFFINEINKYDKLRIYCNKELYRISLTYKTKVTILTENFTSKNEKIKSNVEYKKKSDSLQLINKETFNNITTETLYPNGEGGV